MLFGIPTDSFTTGVAAGTADISVSICSLFIEASSLIYKDSSHSDNASISFVLLELVLISSCSYCYVCFVFLTDNAVLFRPEVCSTVSPLQGKLVDALPNITT